MVSDGIAGGGRTSEGRRQCLEVWVMGQSTDSVAMVEHKVSSERMRYAQSVVEAQGGGALFLLVTGDMAVNSRTRGPGCV